MFALITNYLEPIACLVYLIALIVHYRVGGQKALHALLVYYAVAVILLTVGCLKVGDNVDYNIWLYDLVALGTSVSLGFYFYRLLETPTKKKIVLLLIAIYVIYALVRNFTLQGIRFFDSIGYAIVSGSVAIYVFMYFHQVLKNVSEGNILGEFNFWLASGYLFYYVGSFLIFVSYYHFTVKFFEHRTKEGQDLLTALWGVHNILLFISALSLLTGSLWLTYRKR